MKLIKALQDHNAGRDPERLAMKFRKMRSTPFAFMRGSCHWVAHRMSSLPVAQKGPVGWICGDLHAENFGSYKGDNRLVYFDLNDFDEAVLAPGAWDVVHLLASVHVAAQDWTGIDVDALVSRMLDAYFAALAHGKPMWVERETATGRVHALLESLRERHRAHWLDKRTVRQGRRRRLRVDGLKALPADESERARAETIVAAHAKATDREDFFEVLDVARRVAGTGSLGQERYVVLVRGKGAPDGHYLLDVKRAEAPSRAPWLVTSQPEWGSQAHRVVALQQRLQAVSAAFLSPCVVGRDSYIVRALQPAEDRVSLTPDAIDLVQVGATPSPGLSSTWLETFDALARCGAWAHLRGAGRQGADGPDLWIDWGRSQQRRRSLLAAAHALANRLTRDWRRYAQAYDDGEFTRLVVNERSPRRSRPSTAVGV